MNQEDASRVAERLRELAELIETSLVRALSIAHGWAGNMKATSLQANGTPQLWCWEHERDVTACQKAELGCSGEPMRPNDTTGEAGVDAAAGFTVDARRHVSLVAQFGALDASSAGLAQLIKLTVPESRRSLPAPSLTAPEGACRSCWRFKQNFTPTAEGRYRDYCLWCGEFKASHGQEPPRALLEKRARGQRITTSDVERHLVRVS